MRSIAKAEKENSKTEIELVTTNDNGVYYTDPSIKKKDKNVLAYENCEIHYQGKNGLVIATDISPKFEGKTYEDFAKEVKYLEPMSAHEDETFLDRDEQLEHEIAELKMDGHRGTLHIGEKYNRNFSRNPSKKTGWLKESSDQVPHIRDMTMQELAGTVIDGEFDYGTNSNQVQSVMGSNPDKAIQYQFKNGFIKYMAFDILYYKGINVQAMPLWKRKVYLYKVIKAFREEYGNCSMEFTPIYAHQAAYSELVEKWTSYDEALAILDELEDHTILVDSYVTIFGQKVSEGLEGLIVKDMNARYEQLRSKSFIKLKAEGTWDCVMMGVTESTKVYTGKDIEGWQYWESAFNGELINAEMYPEYKHGDDLNLIPVTKPYFHGWCGGISFGVWTEVLFDDLLAKYKPWGIDQLTDEGLLRPSENKNYLHHLVQVGDCKGLKDEALIDLKENWEKYVEEERVVEVLANGILDKKKGSLRHPRFFKWRDDKDSSQCDWKSHIREM